MDIEDIKEFAAFIVFTLLVSVIILCSTMAILSVPLYYLGSFECKTKGQSFTRTEYSLISGCMVEYRGKMVPLEAVKFVEHKEAP